MIKPFNSFPYEPLSYRLWCEMLDQVEVQLLIEEKDDQQWWKDLSPEEQSKYLSDHPQSAKAKAEKEKEEGESATSKSFKDLKDHVSSVSKSIGVDAKTVVKAFKQPSVYNTVKALGGSISIAAKTVQGMARGVGKTLDVGGAAISDTPAFKQLEKGVIKVDEFMDKHPALKRATGAAVAGVATYQWLKMSFSGDIESDYDVSLIADGLAGKAGFADLINTPSGVKSMGLLGAGLATGGLPIWMSGGAGLALAVAYTGAKKLGDTETGKKLKAKMGEMAKEAGSKIGKGAKAIDKKIGRDDRNEGFSEMYTTVIEKDEHKKSVQYKKLAPRMKDAVDLIFKKMDAKPSDFLNSFEKTIVEVSKKFKVPEKKLMNYFEKEMLSI